MLAAGDDALILVPRPASAPAQAYRGAKIGIGVNGSGQSVHELAVYGAALKGKITRRTAALLPKGRDRIGLILQNWIRAPSIQ